MEDQIIVKSSIPKRYRILYLLTCTIALIFFLWCAVFFIFFPLMFLIDILFVISVVIFGIIILRKKHRQKNKYSGAIQKVYFFSILFLVLNLPFIGIFWAFIDSSYDTPFILMFMIMPMILPSYSLYLAIKTEIKVQEYTNIYRTALNFGISLSIIHFLLVFLHRLINIFMLLK